MEQYERGADHVGNKGKKNIPDQKDKRDCRRVVNSKCNQRYTDDGSEGEDKEDRQTIRLLKSSEKSDHGLKFLRVHVKPKYQVF